MNVTAFGQNYICKQLDKKDETIMGEVVLAPNKKLPVGSIVFYDERDWKPITLGTTQLHCLWEARIMATATKKKEIKEILDDLPDMRNKED